MIKILRYYQGVTHSENIDFAAHKHHVFYCRQHVKNLNRNQYFVCQVTLTSFGPGFMDRPDLP